MFVIWLMKCVCSVVVGLFCVNSMMFVGVVCGGLRLGVGGVVLFVYE